MSNIQEHFAGMLQPFNFMGGTQVPEHRLFGLSPSYKDESRVHAGSNELSKHHAYFQVDSYGDLHISERDMKLADFYVERNYGIMLGLQIGTQETATSTMAGENNADESPSSGCSQDVGVSEPVVPSTTGAYFSARIQDLMELKSTKYVTAPDVEFDIEASKPTWTQLDPNEAASDEDEWSDNDEEGSNREEFNRLKEHPKWGPFFCNDRYSNLKLGGLLGQGSQARVYDAIDSRDSKQRTNMAMKVFEEGFRLRKLQKWWPKGLVEAANSQRYVMHVPYVCWAIGAQLLEDNRFAFVFPKLNCDLRKRIDDAMRIRNGIGPPFSPFTCFCIISDIAAGMAYLHNRDMMHQDLKAANVLDMRNVSKDETCIMMLIADFESSVGILGTGFWRAPEILRQVAERDKAGRAGERRNTVKFTKEADVYSFAMTCYEVLTGLLPFEGRSAQNVDGVIHHGERPELPLGICPRLRDLICRCWNSDPLQRPSFNSIRTDLIEIGKMESTAWNIHIRYKQVIPNPTDAEIFHHEEETKNVKDIDWEWPIYDQLLENRKVVRRLRESGKFFSIIFETENKLIRRVPSSATDNDKPDVVTPFEVTLEHTVLPAGLVYFNKVWSYDQSRYTPDTVTIRLKSPDLIQVAKRCLPTLELLCVEKPTIDAKDMFIVLEAFKDALQSIQQDVDHESKAQYWELKHLLRFLETHYKDTTAQIQRMRREKKVSFDLLWAFLYNGERVHYRCPMTGWTLHGIVTLARYEEGRAGVETFVVKLECRDYNGRKYVQGFLEFPVHKFNGEESFDSIGIGPMGFLELTKAAAMEAMFLSNGRKFYDIVAQGSTYMEYVGPRIWKKHDYRERDFSSRHKFQLEKQKADGRVMVDLLSFARTNPDFPLDNAKPPTNHIDHAIPSGDEQEMPSDEELMLAPAVVFGFSFSLKQWGGFDINGFSEIHFDDQAFDRDLVLTDPDKKDMLLALVTQYLKDPSADDNAVPKIDPISNKGDGCIFLCYGPPGTGKTLTAESIAEKLHRPLWPVSVFELGVKSRGFEKKSRGFQKLTDILDIASQWRAVLLLDVADVYLKKRTSNADPEQMAMTAIFLRLLEYYRGVLFLTTNHVASFDDAFLSRISVFLRYHRFSVAQREAIWRRLLARALIQNPDLTLFRDYELNGREIQCCIRIAQALAESAGKELTTDHVLRVVKMPVELRKNLDDAVKGETEERSITRVLGGANIVPAYS